MEMRVPPGLFPREGFWHCKRVIRGHRFRQTTGIPVGGEKELRKAISRQRELEEGWERGLSGEREVPTFGEWWETYQATYSSQKAKPAMDATMVSHALVKWKHQRIDRINPTMCERHLVERLKKVAQGTVTRERGLLQAMFTKALRDRLIQFNPFEDIERVRDEVRMRVMTWEEEAKLREVLTPQFQRWLTFMVGTGLRLDESRAVKMEHLDRTKRLIAVQAFAAKGGKARHTLLYPEVEEALDTQWNEMGKLWSANPQNYREVLFEGAKKAHIEHLYPHALRHTFATRYMQAGGRMEILSKLLGHASVTMTERVYVHLKATDLALASAGVDVFASPKVVAFKKA